jgi:hypothetical protein
MNNFNKNKCLCCDKKGKYIVYKENNKYFLNKTIEVKKEILENRSSNKICLNCYKSIISDNTKEEQLKKEQEQLKRKNINFENLSPRKKTKR